MRKEPPEAVSLKTPDGQFRPLAAILTDVYARVFAACKTTPKTAAALRVSRASVKKHVAKAKLRK